MISDQQFATSASLLKVPVAAIKAVAQVESKDSGFLPTGEPLILFEPHIFWKQLKQRNIDPNTVVKGNEDILYPVWGTKPYGKYSEQHARLQRAVAINRDAALSSASWGKFQIMGFNWQACGCANLQDFISRAYKSEDEHLALFCNYVKTYHLDDELQHADWAGFARGYNGPLYVKNSYDKKLKTAFDAFSKTA
jgi:hypothetical protein